MQPQQNPQNETPQNTNPNEIAVQPEPQETRPEPATAPAAEPAPVAAAPQAAVPAQPPAEPQPQAQPQPEPRHATNPLQKGNELVRRYFTDKLAEWLFRLGFASIFIINSVYAALEPESFTQLLYSNPIANAIGYADIMVKIAMVNDLLLGVFILIGWRKKFTYAWAGVWLLTVAGIKLMNLFV